MARAKKEPADGDRAPKPAQEPGSGQADRRRFSRVPVRLAVRYRTTLEETMLRSTTQEMGGGGIRLHVDAPVALHTTLRIEVAWPGLEEPVVFTGEVVWCQPCLDPEQHGQPIEVGVRFLQISPGDRLTILDYVEEQIGE